MKNELYLIFALCLINLSLVAQTQTCPQNQNHPNLQILSQVVNGETFTREYILNIPVNYDATFATPLIINMHGFGDCAADYAETIGKFYQFDELADKENIIVAYPQGAYRPEKEDTYWEPGDNGEENIYENDVFFIEELINSIGLDYNLDMEMIYACGYSNGGMMTYSLACNRSTLFSAVGIMSGVMLEEDCIVERPVPIITFHGIGDEVLPYNGSIWYQSVADVVGFWLDQNGIPSSNLSTSELNEGKVERDNYSGGNDNSCISLYTINEEYDKPGDHVWFSDKIEGNTPNEILWSFFTDNCASITSIEQTIESTYMLYPNPVINEFKIIGGLDNYTIVIRNMSGKKYASINTENSEQSIDVTSLQSGLYFVQVKNLTNNIIEVHKILKK